MTEPIFPDSVPWATARMMQRRGVWGLICYEFPGETSYAIELRDAVYSLTMVYAWFVGGTYTNQLWADAFNWACEQLGYTEDYYE